MSRKTQVDTTKYLGIKHVKLEDIKKIKLLAIKSEMHMADALSILVKTYEKAHGKLR